ncbi:ribonuclease Z [Bacillus marinisedimentorum]|uniref:ribonuclease Z n=1 Tax=Bacillus marinisedimentorum TaxID=1821260 RepID=UPI0008733880|nr:ribonuclease Z [Bacillus marinisedimentorum]
MELVFLGTGAGVPSKQRNVSAAALHLLAERGTTWLFDCGEATQHRILYTNVKPGKVDKIFITHMHGDHIFGLPGFLGSRSFQGGTEPLTIYGPPGIREYVLASLRLSKTHLRYKLEIAEIEEGIIFEDEQFTVEARKLEHGIPSYGYRITEKEKPGKLDVEKLKAEGVKPGPVYQKIKAGEQVKLENGKILYGKDFIGEPKTGRKVAVLGDTRATPAVLDLARDADLLVHEATFSKDEAGLAFQYFHSTAEQAAESARQAGVRTLVLSHISSRYQNESATRLRDEAARIFPDVYVAEDLWSIEIPAH